MRGGLRCAFSTLRHHCGSAPALIAMLAAAAASARPNEHEIRLPVVQADVMTHVGSAVRFTRDQIARSGVASLGDFLVRYADAVIDRTSRSGGFSAVYLRGADPSHTVVLIDGVRQNDPLSSRGSAIDLNTLPLDAIESIEVERGPRAIMERGALAGVVRISTRADHAARRRLHAEVGAGGVRSVFYQNRVGSAGLGATTRSDGLGGLSGSSRNDSARVHFHRDAGLDIHFGLVDSRSEGAPDDAGGPTLAVIRIPERRASRVADGRFDWTRNDSAGIWRWTATVHRRESTEQSPGVAPGVRDPFGLPSITSESVHRSALIELRWSPERSDVWEVEIGSDFERERGRIDSLIDVGRPLTARFERRRDTESGFFKLRRDLRSGIIEAGARVEHDNAVGTSYHPAIAASVRLPKNAVLSAALASGQKTPSFYALGHPFIGNPDLEPERARQLEIAVESTPIDQAQLRVSIFKSTYRDLIDFDAGPPPRLVNRSQVRAQGLEFRWGHWFANDAQLSLDAVWQRVRDSGGALLRFRPQLMAGVAVSWQLGGWQARGNLRFVDRRFDSSIPTGLVSLRAYTTLDLVLDGPIGDWRGFVAIDNALDEDHEHFVGDQSTDRRLRIGLSIAF